MAKNIAKIAKEMVLLETYDDYEIQEIIEILQSADQMYFNQDDTFFEDNEYDALKLYAQQRDPSNPYFIGIGSAVRGGKVKLPFQLGSLDQIYENEIGDWLTKHSLINRNLVITDKLDGTSCEILYDDNGHLQIAYSRGDGVEGADITRHIKHIPSVPRTVNCGGRLAVRAEIIIKKSAFPIMKSLVKTRAGKEYKNPRNCVAGLMNGEKNPQEAYQHITVIAHQILDHKNLSEMAKYEQLHMLNSLGFETVFCTYVNNTANCDLKLDFLTMQYCSTLITDKFLSDLIVERREKSEYELDGVVIEADSARERNRITPTRETLNPAYAVKYKVADLSNQAITPVIKVEWNLSKHAIWKPRVQFAPVNLVGVTIQHATGFNAKFIYENKIGPGALIQITRSGDVIPFIQKVVQPAAAPQMPSEEWNWNETEVDAVALNAQFNPEVAIQQTIDFFSSIQVPFLKEGNIRHIFDQEKFSSDTRFVSSGNAILTLIGLTRLQWQEYIGENGNKIYDGIHKKFSNIPVYVLLGSLPFFGRGLGKRKFKKLTTAFGNDKVLSLIEELAHNRIQKDTVIELIDTVEGFDTKTAEKVVNGMSLCSQFLKLLKDIITVTFTEQVATSDSAVLANQKVVFTGFRDAELLKLVEANGGQMQDGVSSKTTLVVAADVNSTSGKVKKALDLNIRVITIDELREMLDVE